LTSEQVQRLCGVDRTICQDVLTTLVEMKFLSRKPNGAYARVTDGAEIPGSRAAKTALRAESTIQLSQGIAADTARRSAMTGDRPDRVERRRGRSAEELRKQRDEIEASGSRNGRAHGLRRVYRRQAYWSLISS
jgi:hypothetical protein